MLDLYLKRIQESYIISNKTVSVDLDKFENGESNILLVAGIPAGGKTTLGKQLAKKYKCKLLETDYPCLDKEDPVKCYQNIYRKSLKSNKRYIIEGVLVFWSCLDIKNKILPFFNECKHTPIIILGPSVMKAAYQGWKRDKEDISLRQVFSWYVKNGIFDMKAMNVFKKERFKVKGSNIKEFKT